MVLRPDDAPSPVHGYQQASAFTSMTRALEELATD
jgi:hypothetical protein